VSYSDTLTGGGEVDLTGIAEVPEYVLAHVITAGPQVRTPFDQAPDLVTKVGWIQWGALVDIGFGERAYWRDPIWINGLYWIWGLDAGQHVNATRLRYWFSPGTEVYLLVGP
jgi:hypothetical protein